MDTPIAKPVFIILLMLPTVQLMPLDFKHLSHMPAFVNISLDNGCFLDIDRETEHVLSGLIDRLHDDKVDLLYLNLHLYYNETKNFFDIIWTIANPDRVSLMQRSDMVMLSYLHNRVISMPIQGEIICVGRLTDVHFLSRDDVEHRSIIGGVVSGFLEELGISESETIDVGNGTCNGTNCTDVCGKRVDEPFLVILTYYWVATILMYSPNVVYVLYDALFIKGDNLTHYHVKDWPYSVKRFFLMLSAFMLSCCPSFRVHLKKRPMIRTILIVWISNVFVQIFHMWLELSAVGPRLAYREVDSWMPQVLSHIMRYRVYGAVVSGGLVITLLLLQTFQNKTFEQLLKEPEIFIFSSSGHFHKGFIKKTHLKYFLKHRENSELTEGKVLIAIHAERFMLLFNYRLWFLLLKESCSRLLVSDPNKCRKCLSLVPDLIFSLICLVLNVVMNFLWGLFPLIGLFFTCLSFVTSWLELLRVVVIASYFAFFVLVIGGNNLVFVFNVLIYTTMYTFPCSSIDDLSMYFMIFPIILYLIMYWKTFTGGYKTVLELIFKMDLETSVNEQNSTQISFESTSESAQQDNVQSISIKEFEFVCGQCSPVRKKILNILIKIIITGIFMLLTLTVLFLKAGSDSFSKIAKLVGFIVIVLLPRVMEKIWSGDETGKQEELERKVGVAVRRWNSHNGFQRKKPNVVELENAECTWCFQCCEITNLATYGQGDNKGTMQGKRTVDVFCLPK